MHQKHITPLPAPATSLHPPAIKIFQIYSMTDQLGRAIARGLLPEAQAEAAIWAAALRADRLGELDDCDVNDVISVGAHLLEVAITANNAIR